jgi:hypothetical protein
LFTLSPSFSTYIDDVYAPVEYCNWLALSPQQAGWIVKGCMAVFVGIVIATCRTPRNERRDWRTVAEGAIIVLGMLLFSERTWKHHCVTLAIPFAVLSHRLAYEPSRRWPLVTAIVISQVLIATTSTGLLPNRWAEMAQVYGAFVGAFVVLLFALAARLVEAAGKRAKVESMPARSAAA